MASCRFGDVWAHIFTFISAVDDESGGQNAEVALRSFGSEPAQVGPPPEGGDGGGGGGGAHGGPPTIGG